MQNVNYENFEFIRTLEAKGFTDLFNRVRLQYGGFYRAVLIGSDVVEQAEIFRTNLCGVLGRSVALWHAEDYSKVTVMWRNETTLFQWVVDLPTN